MEIWIWWQRWSEISFLRVDTINLVSARNGKVGRIYFLIVMPVYGTVWREGSIFSWLWLSPARATHLTGHMGASHHWEEQCCTSRNWSRVGHGWWVAHTVTVGGVGPSPGIRKATAARGGEEEVWGLPIELVPIESTTCGRRREHLWCLLLHLPSKCSLPRKPGAKRRLKTVSVFPFSGHVWVELNEQLQILGQMIRLLIVLLLLVESATAAAARHLPH